MLVDEVTVLAVELLERAQRRLVAVDAAGCCYDHGAAEALVVLAQALDAATRDVDAARVMLRVALGVLTELPEPATRGAFQIRFLRRFGREPTVRSV